VQELQGKVKIGKNKMQSVLNMLENHLQNKSKQ